MKKQKKTTQGQVKVRLKRSYMSKNNFPIKFILRSLRQYQDVETGSIDCEISFTTQDGKRDLCIKRADLYDPETVKRLLDQGCLATDQEIRAALRAISCEICEETRKSSHRCGLVQGNLLTRANAIELQISNLENRVEKSPIKGPHDLVTTKKGNCMDFVDGASGFLQKSPELVLVYLATLSAPLGQLCEWDNGFILNLFGETTTGKSSALRFGKSLITKCTSDKMLDSAANTLGWTQDAIPYLPGLPFFFGDLRGDRSATLINDLHTYCFNIGEGRTRAKQGERETPPTGYICVVMSSEISLTNAKKSHPTGEQARLIQLPLAQGTKGGIFSSNPQDAAVLFEDLDRLMKDQYGSVMPEWFRYLSGIRAELSPYVEKMRHRPLLLREGITPIEGRIEKNFRLLFVTGLLAIKARLLPLSEAELKRALVEILTRVFEFNNHGDPNSVAIRNELVAILGNDSYFPSARVGAQLNFNREMHLGFTRNQNGVKCRMVDWGLASKKFKHDAQAPALKALRSIALRPSTKGELTQKIMQLGIEGRPSYYLIPISTL